MALGRNEPAIQLAAAAFAHVVGAPRLVGCGGSIPVAAALATQGVPPLVTGFALPDANVHAPNERLLLDYLPLGIATARSSTVLG
jgi:acetylornithine deacetylase/succinyl-diaminopimelate desuccinylase-like protein